MDSENGYVRKYGIVIFLDVLGVKNMETEDFIHRFDRCLKEYFEYLNRRIAKSHDDSRIRIVGNMDDVGIFGDTVIIPIEINQKHIFFNIHHFSLTHHVIIRFGLKEGLFFNGVISAGEYFVNEKGYGIIGPAINEAVDYYNKIRWGGLIFSNYAGSEYSKMVLEKQTDPNYINVEQKFIFKYDVPLKSGKNECLWAIGWPLFYHIANRSSQDRIVQARNEFIEHLEKVKELCHPDANAQPIFDNTIQFYDFYCDNYKDFIEYSVGRYGKQQFM